MNGCGVTFLRVFRAWRTEQEEDVNPLFFPGDPTAAITEIQLKVNRPPFDFGIAQSRWTLQLLLEELSDTFNLQTLSGLWRVMHRLGFSYQRARAYVHSPDPCYDDKLDYIRKIMTQYVPGEVEVLFADQFTYYNHPDINYDFAHIDNQPLSKRAIGGTKQRRIAACMNCFTGEVTFIQRQRTTIPSLVQLYKDVCTHYAQAKQIYIIMDNWPVHFHPDIIEALVPQESPFKFRLPQSWAKLKPSGKYAHLNLPIQIVTLPTYASWLNPIEKLWKLLKSKVIHHHSFAHCFKELHPVVETFLSNLKHPSKKLLSFVGLLNENGIFASSILEADPNFKFGG